jgi:cytochrome c-type biogenesis protein
MLEIGGVGILTAFLAGLISFLSPCVLPLVPGYLSYIAGDTLAKEPSHVPGHARVPALVLSSCFVLGFSTIFVLLGASATVIGQALLRYRFELNLFGGLAIIAFGILMLDLIRAPALYRELRIGYAPERARPLSAYLLGTAFGFGWTPCIGPVLGAILTVSATSPDASTGLALLSTYAAGLGVPFLLAAIFTEAFAGRMRSMRILGRAFRRLAGVIMILMGMAMVTGTMTTLAYWILDLFPVLQRIG